MIQIERSHFNPILYFAAVICVCLLGFYFRMYMWHIPGYVTPRPAEIYANTLVYRAMKEQIKKDLDRRLPDLSLDEKEKLTETRLRNVLRTEKTNFEKAVLKAEKNVRHFLPERQRSPYLLGADSYYYFFLTRLILTNGSLSDQFKNGTFFDRYRKNPKGSWDVITLHPYVGYLWYQCYRFFKSDAGLMEAVAYVPILVMAAVVFVFFRLCSLMRLGLAAALIGAVSLILSPMFIQRGAYGWYDTDPYNYLFPYLVLMSFFSALYSKRHVMLDAAAAGFFTGFYSFFWIGWPFLLILTAASGFLISLVSWFKKEHESANHFFKYALYYFLFSIFFAVIFITPRGFYEMVSNSWTYLFKFAVTKIDWWPSIFLTIGETKSLSPKALIFHTSNYVTTGIAVFGLVWSGFSCWWKKENIGRSQWLALVVFLIPLTVMGLTTERFVVLFAIPFSLFVALGAEHLHHLFLEILDFSTLYRRFTLAFRSAVIVFLLFLSLPMPLIHAEAVTRSIRPVMNLVWDNALTALKNKTPKEALVHTWWPPGYFVLAVGDRGVFIDGGSQHRPESYWVARALMADDEVTSAGLFRMLNAGGNDALDYLLEKGMALPEAVRLLSGVVKLDRSTAYNQLPGWLSDTDKRSLLDLTHGTQKLKPTYVLIYDDLIKQNAAVSLPARWDFKKARQILSEEKKEPIPFGFLYGKKQRRHSLNETLKITGPVLQSSPAAKLVRREGSRLYFANGHRVDLSTKASLIDLPDKKIHQPVNLFYMEGNRFIEKKYPNVNPRLSALLIESKGVFTSVLADRDLIRSMLFRLYYLNGKGLRVFRPLIHETRPNLQTVVDIFQIDWNALPEGGQPQNKVTGDH